MEDWVIWAVLAVLLMLSASFSSFEAALFSLDDEDRGRAPERVRRMLEEPRPLLVTVLLGNLFVNLAYFALAGRIDWGEGSEAPFLRVLVPLVVILIAGEILPKTLALRAARTLATVGSLASARIETRAPRPR